MFTTKALLCFALMFFVTAPARSKHVSKTSTHKILDIIHRLLLVAKHNGHHHYDQFVAFDVALTRDFRGQKAGDKVLYNKINFNTGRAYRNGEFICPIDGVYEFTWTSLSPPNKNANTGIYVNGKFRRWNYNRERTNKTYLLSTMSVILGLKKNDRVWIGTWNGEIIFGNSHEHSTFQGKLLHAE